MHLKKRKKLKPFFSLIFSIAAVITTPRAALGQASINHYSDYGVAEQLENTNNNESTLNIQTDPFGYSDAYTDTESDLQYLAVRYYDPSIMRFTAMDSYPLLNRYAYADENPVMDDDPSGHTAVGAGNNSYSSTGHLLGYGGVLLTGIGLVTTTGMLIGSMISLNPIGLIAGSFNVVSGITGGLSSGLANLSSGAREDLGIVSLVSGAVAIGVDGTASVYNKLTEPWAKQVSMEDILIDTAHNRLSDNNSFLSTLRASCSNPTCTDRAAVLMSFLVDGEQGGYAPNTWDQTPKSRRLYQKLNNLISYNESAKIPISTNSFEATILQKLNQSFDSSEGVYGLRIYDAEGNSHITTMAVQNGKISIFEGAESQEISFSRLLSGIGYNDSNLNASIFKAFGGIKPYKIEAFLSFKP